MSHLFQESLSVRVLAVSYLFPNSVYPNRGVFVLNRLKAVREYADVTVINPILWFPLCSRLARYQGYERIPRHEVIDGIDVYHPRFLSVPLVLKAVVALMYCLAVLPLALRLHKKCSFDIIDLHWTFPDLPAGRLLSKMLGISQLATVRGDSGLHLNERSFPSFVVKRLLPRSAVVITLSDRLREHCLRLGVPPARLVTIRNGVDSEQFRHLPQQECRRQLALPSAATIVLAAGYMTPHKGFDRIIRALPELLNSCPDVELYLLGPSGAFAKGDRTAELNALTQRLGVADHVHLVGEVANADLVTWYNAADLFCLSSRTEGCPNVVLEALACGCPVVGTDVGAVSELIVDEAMGIVVDNSGAGVRSGLLAATRRIYDRPAIATRMRPLDWNWCARQVLAVYRRASSKKGAAIGGATPLPREASSPDSRTLA